MKLTTKVLLFSRISFILLFSTIVYFGPLVNLCENPFIEDYKILPYGGLSIGYVF